MPRGGSRPGRSGPVTSPMPHFLGPGAIKPRKVLFWAILAGEKRTALAPRNCADRVTISHSIHLTIHGVGYNPVNDDGRYSI